jgi:hypothetical protein
MTDYSEQDFSEMHSSEEIEQNIKVFYDRMHELINPIEHERLKLDSVAQIKGVVKTFYQTKQAQCEQLLLSLDQMNHERRYVMELKQQQYNAASKHNSGNLYAAKGPYSSVLPSKHHATEKVLDVRINVQLNRIRKFKNVAA